jgi:hypothetical protein
MSRYINWNGLVFDRYPDGENRIWKVKRSDLLILSIVYFTSTEILPDQGTHQCFLPLFYHFCCFFILLCRSPGYFFDIPRSACRADGYLARTFVNVTTLVAMVLVPHKFIDRKVRTPANITHSLSPHMLPDSLSITLDPIHPL